MKLRRVSVAIGVLCAGVLLTGCMPKMTIEEFKEMMPQRPAELDRLNDFAGSWVAEGEATSPMVEGVMKSHGEAEGDWEGDGWYLVTRHAFSMEGMDDMYAIETWTYDSHSKKYRSTWTDSMGSTGTGEATYNAATKTWNMRATSYGMMGKTTMKGTAKSVDADTMEWTWTEYSGLMKTMEMTGTARRKQPG